MIFSVSMSREKEMGTAGKETERVREKLRGRERAKECGGGAGHKTRTKEQKSDSNRQR